MSEKMGEITKESARWRKEKVPRQHVEMGEYERRIIKVTDTSSERMRTLNGESDM